MTTQTEALKLALECAERCESIDGMYSWADTITAIKEALAQPVSSHGNAEEALKRIAAYPFSRAEELSVEQMREIAREALMSLQDGAQPSQDSVAMADYMALVEKYAFLKASQRKQLTYDEALKLALNRIGNYIEKRKSARGIDIESIHAFDLSVDGGFELCLSDLELLKEALAQQCVCGEPNSSGTHRTDGPCLAPQPEQEKERCVGCEACIDTACGRDECPKGWPKAAQSEQEPVAWLYFHNRAEPQLDVQLEEPDCIKSFPDDVVWKKPLYTTPPQRTWVGLTDLENAKFVKTMERGNFLVAIYDIEKKLKELNT